MTHTEWKKNGETMQEMGGRTIFISPNTYKVIQMSTLLSSPLVKHIHAISTLMKQTLLTLEPRIYHKDLFINN